MVSNKFKVFLWKINMLPEKRCPICKSKTVPHYSGEPFSAKNYTCENDKCEFNK